MIETKNKRFIIMRIQLQQDFILAINKSKKIKNKKFINKITKNKNFKIKLNKIIFKNFQY